jgi:uncharacterized protein YneF (UPF0154 family)
MKKTIIAIVVLVILGFGVYYFTNYYSNNTVDKNPVVTETDDSKKPDEVKAVDKNAPEVVIGQSVEGKSITAYHFGTGNTEILFVGGIHGGYSYNTSLVAFQLMDYLKQNPKIVPANVKVTVIPVLNPDGLNKVVGTSDRFSASDVSKDQTVVVSGRFNANDVDINRNFDCDWQATGKWQNKTVSGGDSAFSEPESLALKSYVDNNKPTAVIAWYSSAGGVYASNCHNGVPAETTSITKIFAKASGYPAHEDFDYYELTGDMVNWFAKNNIPAISVLLTNHTDTEWSKNKAGIEAILKHYTK